MKGLEISEYPEGDDYESWFQEDTIELINREQAKHAKSVIKDCDKEDRKTLKLYSAFDAYELGEMLPKDESFRIKFTEDEFIIWRDEEVFEAESMAEAMGEMWCYLKENKLI